MTWVWFHKLGSPPHFYRIAGRLIPWFAWPALALGLYGFVGGLAIAPADYLQGEGYRIVYVHAPAAWLSLMVYTVMAASAAVGLIWRMPVAHAIAASCAVIGASFTLLALATGSLWGRPMWGTYWEWDARLTSVLILFLMYLGLIALWRAVDDPSRAARAAAILTLVGALNLPIIKFSVDWWNTLHQPASVFRVGGPTIHASILVPLLTMAVAFSLLFVTLHLAAMRNEILRRRIRALHMVQASAMRAT